MRYILFLLTILLFNSCKPASDAKEHDPLLQELAGDNYSDYLRTPVNADGSIDSTKMSRILFDKPIHNFGVFGQEEKQKHTFTFTNTSDINLYVMDVSTSCGCTVASYSDEKIAPGDSGKININYDPKGRQGLQEKKIIVTTNAYPNTTELTIIAEVLKN